MADELKVGWRDVVRGMGEWAKEQVQMAANVIYSDTAKDMAARGATEITNALYTGNAYGPGSSLVAQQPEAEQPIEHEPFTPQIRGTDRDQSQGMSR